MCGTLIKLTLNVHVYVWIFLSFLFVCLSCDSWCILSPQVTGRGFYGNEGETMASSWVENLFSQSEREQWSISTNMMWVFLPFAVYPWGSVCVFKNSSGNAENADILIIVEHLTRPASPFLLSLAIKRLFSIGFAVSIATLYIIHLDWRRLYSLISSKVNRLFRSDRGFE